MFCGSLAPTPTSKTAFSFADAMVQNGFTDPLKPPSVASRSAAAVAVILGGNGSNAGGGGGSGSNGAPLASPLPLPSPPRPSSPLFAAVLLRSTAEKATVDGDARATAESSAATVARRVVASACAALHGLLRSGGTAGFHDKGTGNRARGSTTSAAIAAARAVAPCLEAFLSFCWSRSSSRASLRPSVPAPPTSWRGIATGNGGNDGSDADVAISAGSGDDGRFQAERELKRGGEKEEEEEVRRQEGGWREAYRAALSLLDLVDVFIEVETSSVSTRKGHRAWSTSTPPGHLEQRRQAADTRLLSAERRFRKWSPGNGARGFWAEVRGLCRREKEARVATSRWLASLLKQSAEVVECEGGGGRGQVSASRVVLKVGVCSCPFGRLSASALIFVLGGGVVCLRDLVPNVFLETAPTSLAGMGGQLHTQLPSPSKLTSFSTAPPRRKNFCSLCCSPVA